MTIENAELNTQDTSEQSAQDLSGVAEQGLPDVQELKYEKGVSLSDRLRENPNLAQEMLDLEKLERFKWNGKVITPKDLKSMFMMHGDYTKKTQSIAQEKKYYDNLDADLEKVRQNPQLASEFVKVYPAKFHAYLKYVGSQSQGLEAPKQELGQAEDKETELPKQDPRVEQLWERAQKADSEAAQAKVDALFDRLSTKYNHADEEKILARVQSLITLHNQDPKKHRRPDEKDIEDLFKREHETFEKRLKEHVAKIMEEQRKANLHGRGPAAGGGIPGGAPKMPRTIKEATEMMLSDPQV
jgi:hypothetical protein